MHLAARQLSGRSTVGRTTAFLALDSLGVLCRDAVRNVPSEPSVYGLGFRGGKHVVAIDVTRIRFPADTF